MVHRIDCVVISRYRPHHCSSTGDSCATGVRQAAWPLGFWCMMAPTLLSRLLFPWCRVGLFSIASRSNPRTLALEVCARPWQLPLAAAHAGYLADSRSDCRLDFSLELCQSRLNHSVLAGVVGLEKRPPRVNPSARSQAPLWTWACPPPGAIAPQSAFSKACARTLGAHRFMCGCSRPSLHLPLLRRRLRQPLIPHLLVVRTHAPGHISHQGRIQRARRNPSLCRSPFWAGDPAAKRMRDTRRSCREHGLGDISHRCGSCHRHRQQQAADSVAPAHRRGSVDRWWALVVRVRR